MEEEPEDIPTTKDVLKAGDIYSRALKCQGTSEELWFQFYNHPHLRKPARMSTCHVSFPKNNSIDRDPKYGNNSSQDSQMNYIFSEKARGNRHRCSGSPSNRWYDHI
uniref:Uncharacterized protein n=1 Tax=Timema bartmani TaxID=61472 RepID=A0A7R9I3F9_9NEOP|nr:unnamed protein product [Timema bartmani]